MNTKQLVLRWFDNWESGNFTQLPLSENFAHHSPYGVIQTKQAYLELVAKHTDKFLGHTFLIHDIIVENDKACVRYTTSKNDHQMEITEWFYCNHQLIELIVSYYDKSNSLNQEIENYSND